MSLHNEGKYPIQCIVLSIVTQVLNRSLDPRTPSTDNRNMQEVALLAVPTFNGLVPSTTPHQVITSGCQRDCIRLRGLPFEASVTDIVTFLAEHARDIVSQGVHLIYNAEVRTQFLQLSIHLISFWTIADLLCDAIGIELFNHLVT